MLALWVTSLGARHCDVPCTLESVSAKLIKDYVLLSLYLRVNGKKVQTVLNVPWLLQMRVSKKHIGPKSSEANRTCYFSDGLTLQHVRVLG